uniref:Rib/alpha-like domain-containing protein n=1 Tax=uncultured Gemella sp. TaxID=254352 RepID=UPI0028D556EE
MIGKNNKYLRDTKSGVKVETYSIKKFKVGAASVVIGASIFFGAAGVASAAEVSGDKTEKNIAVEKVTSSTDEKADVLNNKISAEKEVVKPVTKDGEATNATSTVNNNANADKKVEKKALDKNKLQINIEKVEELLEKINKEKASASTLAAIKIDLENAKNILNSTSAELTQAEIDALVKKLSEKIFVLSSMPKANAPEKVVKEGKNTIANTGSHDSRNGNKIEEGSHNRAASISPTWDSSDNFLIYQRHRASDGSRVVRNGLTEYTENKVDMFAKMTTIGGERYVVYDVFFNNNATGMAQLSRYQIYRLILPPQILDLNSDGTYKGNTLRDLKFETYTRNGDSGTLSQNPERFTRTASYNVNFLNNSVDYGSGWRRLTYFNALDIRHGAEYNGDMRDTFKGNSNDPLLIHAVTRTESKYNRWSYGFGVKTEDKTSAVHMQVKAKLRAGVTDEQVRDAFALAVVGTFGATTNQAYTFISGRDANEPKYTDYPDQPVQPTLREKQAKLYPIQGSSHTKVVGDTIPNTGNPVADKYITRKGSGDFPAGMSWSWKDNTAPSTANAGKFTYTAVASYQDGSTSEDANSGSDGRVYFTINPKKPTITTSVVNKKGLANQTIEVNVGSGVKNGSVVKLYDGDRVIGQGTSNGTTARITVSEALPGNPLKAETTVDSGGIVVSEKSDPVTPTEAPDTQPPTLAITPANQTVVEGQNVTFTVTARDNKHVNLNANDFLTKYGTRVFSGKASITSPTDTETEKVRTITITTTAEDVGKTNTITFNATDNANHSATPVSFTFTVTRRDNIPPTITAGDATVTKNEPITPISVTAVDNPGGVGMRDNNPIEVTGLPSGLTYANNRITGTPTGAPGNSTVTIKAYDKNGNMAPKTITITVRSQADAHNPTATGLTVNQNHTITDDELKAKVSNYAPGTLSIVSKPSTANAGNAGNAVVKVTYPDGTIDNVNVPVTVTDVTGPTITAESATVTKNESITAIPVRAVDNTGGVGMRDNNPIEVTNLPAGLTYANNQITGTPTAGIGYYTVTIKAYDKNNRSTTKQIRITVQGQSEKYNPTGTGLTVTQNHTITDDELKAKVSNYAPGTLSIVSRPSTATAGNAGNAVVKVTYSDGTFDNVNVPVTVTDVTGPIITAEGTTVTSREQITPISVTAEDNPGGVGMRQNNPIEVTGLPAGLTYANNQITGTPTGPAGNSTVTIKAYDRNNTPTTKEITITVQSQATKYNPTGTGLTVEQNHTITDAELYGKVSNYAPGTLSIVSKPST